MLVADKKSVPITVSAPEKDAKFDANLNINGDGRSYIVGRKMSV